MTSLQTNLSQKRTDLLGRELASLSPEQSAGPITIFDLSAPDVSPSVAAAAALAPAPCPPGGPPVTMVERWVWDRRRQSFQIMDEFFPRFKKLCGLAHELGIRVFMHSCGNIAAIVPGLMDAGIDVLQFDQPDLHGIDALASHQDRGRITFWCPVDIQTTLQQRDERIIRAKAREMLDKLWRGKGGFIAGYYGDNASIGLDPKWQDIACDEFRRRGIALNYEEKTHS